MSEQLELLSPVGSMEALQAAIAAGADAVYLGAQSHGARANVGFDDQTLENAIRLAHLYGVRVYVTVNTLLKECEISQVKLLLSKLTTFRADAVIVQDLGLISLIKQNFPQLVIHASTQMSIHNVSGAKLLQKLGVSRVILARECSLDDIHAVAQTRIETEVFVHGAQCIAQSGQCLFSSHIGGRSGNRGRCAQPCRLQYQYKEQKNALLSPKDLNTLAYIPKLINAGVMSFKIEGRLKRPEYVYIVTKAYRKALDCALQGKPMNDLASEQDALNRVFSRGFSSGHAFGAQDYQLMTTQQVGHQGVHIANIQKIEQRTGFFLAHAQMNSILYPGDGLQIRGERRQDIVYSGPLVCPGQTATLRLRKTASQGDEIWRTLDEYQLQQARNSSILPKILFDAKLILQPRQSAKLEVVAGNHRVLHHGDEVEHAQNAPLNQDRAAKQIAKTGNTPFSLRNFQLINDVPSFINAASLNRLRRNTLLLLEETMINNHTLPKAAESQFNFQIAQQSPKLSKHKLYAVIKPGMNRNILKKAGADVFIVYLEQYRQEHLLQQFNQLQPGDVLLLPRQMFEHDLQQAVYLASQRNVSLMADNVGQLSFIKGSDTMNMVGEGVPAWNHLTLHTLRKLGIKTLVLSRELSLKEINHLPHHILELILPVFGRTQLMQLNHCPERVRLGLSDMRSNCRLCQEGMGIMGQYLTDRFQCNYPLSPTHFDRGCLVTLYHNKSLHLDQSAPKMSWLIDLRFEKEQTAYHITEHYSQLLAGKQPSLPFPYAPESGRIFLGVE